MTAAMIAHADRFFIDGDWAAPSSDAQIAVVNPATEEVFIRVAEAQAADVDRAVSAARAAFDRGPWPRMSHQDRAGYLRDIAKRLTVHTDRLADLWTSEVGIVRGLAGAFLAGAPGAFESYAALAYSFPFKERRIPQMGGNVGYLVREPVGVVAAIVPWNFPLLLAVHKIAPALLTGCTIVLKLSPEAPTSGYVMGEIAKEVGLPKGVFNVLTADRQVSELLVRHPGVDKVSFTGSVAAGKKIGAICGERIARCTLELGGKSAAVVLDDYDLDTAADTLSAVTPLVTGQVCAALTRVIVSRHRHDQLVDALAARFGSVKVGDPFQQETAMGPLAMARQRDRVEGYIAAGVKQGAKIATGGGRPPHLGRGYYIQPTVFGHVGNDMTIAREEIFGPVVSVIPAKSEAEAVAIANDSPFGLNASVFTHDADRAYQVARELRSGTVAHNAFRADYSIAFGGFKQSGIGREGGAEGLMPYLESKTVILDAEPRQSS
jgi:aldehyde dehydrogenase (NAD+)